VEDSWKRRGFTAIPIRRRARLHRQPAQQIRRLDELVTAIDKSADSGIDIGYLGEELIACAKK
jgi:hypothetical protein